MSAAQAIVHPLVQDAPDTQTMGNRAPPLRLGAASRGAPPLSAPLVVQYLGFQDAPGRREYEIHVRRGDQSRQYTVWIAQASFAQRHALLQDGPDICYQKLLRALTDAELPADDSIAVTEGDLTDYRESHTRAPRRGFTAPRPQDEAKPETDGPAEAPTGSPW